MENELRTHLLACAEIYAAERDIGLSTLGRLAAGDWRFFSNLRDDDKTFTARKYDEVLQWFSDHWPIAVGWPKEVLRPASKCAA